jgi:hypothetical protein
MRTRGAAGPRLGTAARWALAVAVASACTRPSDVDRFPGTGATMRIVTTWPARAGEDVDPGSEIDFCVSALVDPRTVDDFDGTLGSGSVLFDSQLEVQIVPWRGPGGEPVGRADDEPWCPGSVLSIRPLSELRSGLLYRARLRDTVVGWAGETLDTSQPGWVQMEEDEPLFVLEFTTSASEEDDDGDTTEDAGDTTTTNGSGDGHTDTGGSEGEGDASEPGPSIVPLSTLFATGAVWDPARELCGCHVPTSETANALAHARLDLTGPDTAHARLVQSTRPRDTGFPMVSPRLPSESFLTHKLLRRDGERIHGVLGAPMPPDRPLPYQDLLMVLRWIEAGAELE